MITSGMCPEISCRNPVGVIAVPARSRVIAETYRAAAEKISDPFRPQQLGAAANRVVRPT